MPQIIPSESPVRTGAEPSLLGLAEISRLACSGTELGPLGQQLIARATQNPNDAEAWLDLSLVLQVAGKLQLGLAAQAQALAIRKLYHLPYRGEQEPIRVLALMGPGEMADNTPLELLADGTGMQLDLLYLLPGQPLPESVPDHDVAFVAVGESDQNQPLLRVLDPVVANWPRPVLNRPKGVARLSRNQACDLLQTVPGVNMPLSVRVDRQTLAAIGQQTVSVEGLLAGDTFPIIARPVGSHGGHDLVKLEEPSAIHAYLEQVAHEAFFIAHFVDYRGPDGLFRKARVMLIDGKPFVAHMAVSENWMIHYVTVGMMDSPEKRAKEARFMADFDTDFALRHAAALNEIQERVGLDYFGLDCTDSPDGRLLIFEAESSLLVHNLDSPELFPYKQPQMRKVFAAFRQLLEKATGRANGFHLERREEMGPLYGPVVSVQKEINVRNGNFRTLKICH